MAKCNDFYNNMPQISRLIEYTETVNRMYSGIRNKLPNLNMIASYQTALQNILPNYEALTIRTQILPKLYNSLIFKNINYIYNNSFYQSYYKIFESIQPLLKMADLSAKFQNNIFTRRLDTLSLNGNQLSLDIENIDFEEISELINGKVVNDDIDDEETDFLYTIADKFDEQIVNGNYDVSAGINCLIGMVQELNAKIEKLENNIDKNDGILISSILSFLIGFLFWILPPSAQAINSIKEIVDSKVEVSATDINNAQIGTIAIINRNNADLKEESKEEASVIYELNAGQPVRIISKKDGWSYIEFRAVGKNQEGWILDKFIEEIITK